MSSGTLYPSPLKIARSRTQWFNFHNIMIVLCIVILSVRLLTITTGGGWSDRAQFFGEGDLKPNIVDFLYNEILVNYLIIRVIIFKKSPLVYFLIVISAFAYFTRLPLILLFFAFCFSVTIDKRSKIMLGSAALIISFILLYLRFGESILDTDNSAVFFLTYPLVGIGRLMETPQENSPLAFQYIALFLKPLDAVLFVIDYVGNYGGEISAGRHVGLDLSQFVYIQRLQGGYNAFGTILYPFVLIAGWIVGPILFMLFIIVQYMQYIIVTQDEVLSRRFMYLLLTTGFLFSWASPFVWMSPFLFARLRNRRRG